MIPSLMGFSQTTISGRLSDNSGIPITDATVSYRNVGSNIIIGFSKSSKNGQFVVTLKTGADSIQLDFNHMNYAKKSVVVANKTASYSYLMQPQVRQLDEVKIKESPITQRKDTINYNVDAFLSPNDRVIGDLIKKLPGIEMDGNRILYQGVPIQKYMVNNLDLLEGRYGLINNNMPADAVKSVQVIENDQPIKILDSLVFSNRASLNLVLKKFMTTGTGHVGAGANPALWEAKLTPMTFGKTFQMINSFQTNNIGNDVSEELKQRAIGNPFFGSTLSITDGPNYVSLRDLRSPNFDERKWLQNKIFLGSSNVLQKLKTGLEIKGNISYYDDTRTRRGFASTQFFTNDDMIVNSESIDNRYRIHVLDAGLTLEKNDKKIYLRNYFKYHKRWNNDIGRIYFNNLDSIYQTRAHVDEALLNSLSFARFVAKQLVTVQSSIEYHNTPQKLAVRPGQFEDILNNGSAFDELAQEVSYKSLQWNNSLSFIRKYQNWKFTPYVGLNYALTDLDTRIEMLEQGTSTPLGSDYINDMLNNRLNLNLKLDASLDLKNWKLSFSLPYNFYNFNMQQQGVKVFDHVFRNTFNPSSRLNYQLSPRSTMDALVSAGTTFIDLDNFYSSYIISQYRSLNRYDARLLRTDQVTGNVGYAYKNTIKARFANLRYFFNKDNRDYMYTTLVDPQGRITTGIADQKSSVESHSLSADASQFIFPLKTSVRLGGNTGWTKSDYLINGIIDLRSFFRYSGKLDIIVNSNKYVSGDFRVIYGKNITSLPETGKSSIWHNDYLLNINLNVLKNQSLHVYNSYYTNNLQSQNNQFFMDLNYRFRLSKWKSNLELKVYNIFNNNQFVHQMLNSFQMVQNSFELRPRQFVLSTSFKF